MTIDRTLLGAIWLMLLVSHARGIGAEVAFFISCVLAALAVVLAFTQRR